MRLDQSFTDPANVDANHASESSGAAPTSKKPKLDQSIASLVVMALLAGGGLYYMNLRTAPALTDAADPSPTQVRIDSFMNGGQQQLANIDKALRDTNQLVDALRTRPAPRLASEAIGQGDPFDYVPLNPVADDAPKPPIDPNQLSREQREQAQQQALESAKKLKLQSILHGSQRRACMINGKLYFEGQTVSGFVIQSITREEVTVKTGEFEFRLKMN